MTFEVVHTDQVQAESLRLFMEQLGYFPARPNGGFITYQRELQANRAVSTRTAIKLHNLTREDWVKYKDSNWYAPANLPLETLISDYALNRLMAAKLVEKVKFQSSRKCLNGLVFPPDPLAHLVKVADESYRPLLGLPEVE